MCCIMFLSLLKSFEQVWQLNIPDSCWGISLWAGLGVGLNFFSASCCSNLEMKAESWGKFCLSFSSCSFFTGHLFGMILVNLFSVCLSCFIEIVFKVGSTRFWLFSFDKWCCDFIPGWVFSMWKLYTNLERKVLSQFWQAMTSLISLVAEFCLGILSPGIFTILPLLSENYKFWTFYH